MSNAGEGSTFFINPNRANFSGEKKYYEAFRGVENTQKKNFKSSPRP